MKWDARPSEDFFSGMLGPTRNFVTRSRLRPWRIFPANQRGKKCYVEFSVRGGRISGVVCGIVSQSGQIRLCFKRNLTFSKREKNVFSGGWAFELFTLVLGGQVEFGRQR